MTELEQILIGAGAAASPAQILEGLTDEAAHRILSGAPHTLYQELWHITFWLEVTLDWIARRPTPYPEHPELGFGESAPPESWTALHSRFTRGIETAAAIARDEPRLHLSILCPSKPGEPTRTMSVREQLENLAAHNAYHLGRIVLLRQLAGLWPPASGGFRW